MSCRDQAHVGQRATLVWLVEEVCDAEFMHSAVRRGDSICSELKTSCTKAAWAPKSGVLKLGGLVHHCSRPLP